VGAPFQGRCPASEVNDGGCPGKPDHLSSLTPSPRASSAIGKGWRKCRAKNLSASPTKRRQSLKVFSDSSAAGPMAPQALTAATSRVRAGADGAEGSDFKRDTASPHQLQPFCPRRLLLAGQARGQRQNRLMRVAIKGNICSENYTCPGGMLRTDGLDPASPSMVSLEQRQRCSCRLAKGDQASLTRRFLVPGPCCSQPSRSSCKGSAGV